jgi:hypothetical protein
MSFSSQRSRTPAAGSAHPNPDIGNGGIRRILAGAFGFGAPVPDYVYGLVTPQVGFYHEGDRFLPGAENYVYEPAFELPLKGIVGQGGTNQGVKYPDGAWPVFAAAAPLVSYPLATTAGLGGLQAGAFVAQPLLDGTDEN